MNHNSTEEHANRLSHYFARNGLAVSRCDYWIRTHHPIYNIKPNTSYLTLSDGGYDTIPRITAEDYVRLCGDDIDFQACSAHTYASNRFPLTREYLFKESILYQRLRGFAYRAESIIRAVRPSYLAIPHGSEVISKLLIAKAIKLRIPFMLWESGFFPNTTVLDSVGMHFFTGHNELDAAWDSVGSLSASQADDAQAFVTTWRQRGLSKYNTPAHRRDEDSTLHFVREQKARGRCNTLLFAAQVEDDASVIVGQRGFSSSAQYLDAILGVLPDDWCVIVKQHPKTNAPLQVTPRSDVCVISQGNIHALIDRSDAVATLSSNLGLESLLYGKPILVGGSPHYANKKLTVDVASAADLPYSFGRLRNFKPQMSLVYRYIWYITRRYLVWEDGAPWEAKASVARRQLSLFQDPRAPYVHKHYPLLTDFCALVDNYTHLAGQNLGHEQIIDRLHVPEKIIVASRDFCEPTGERQVATHLADVDRRHLTRYAFAAEVLNGAKRVLDIACGNGYGSYILANQTNAEVVGVDGSSEAIQQAALYWSHPNVSFRRSSVGEFLRLCEGDFDAIVSFETLEHLHGDRAFIEAAWAHLRVGGVLLLSVPNAETTHLGVNPFHIKHYTQKSIEMLFSDLPFRGHVSWCGLTEVTLLTSDIGASNCLVCMLTKGDDHSRKQSTFERLLPYRLVSPPASDYFAIGHERFSTQSGTRSLAGLYTAFNETECHFVYGPYTRMPSGKWRVIFDLLFESPESEVAEAGIRIEVASSCGYLFSVRDLELRHFIEETMRTLEWEVGDETVLHEFRIYIRGRPFQGTLLFRGVQLHRIL